MNIMNLYNAYFSEGEGDTTPFNPPAPEGGDGRNPSKEIEQG